MCGTRATGEVTCDADADVAFTHTWNESLRGHFAADKHEHNMQRHSNPQLIGQNHCQHHCN